MDSGRLGRWWWTNGQKKSLASESDGDVFVGTNLRWVTHGGRVHLVPELNYLKKFSFKSSGI